MSNNALLLGSSHQSCFNLILYIIYNISGYKNILIFIIAIIKLDIRVV